MECFRSSNDVYLGQALGCIESRNWAIEMDDWVMSAFSFFTFNEVLSYQLYEEHYWKKRYQLQLSPSPYTQVCRTNVQCAVSSVLVVLEKCQASYSQWLPRPRLFVHLQDPSSPPGSESNVSTENQWEGRMNMKCVD